MSDRITTNDYIRVKLTEHGKRAMVRHVDAFNDHMRTRYPSSIFRAPIPKLDDQGCLREQFWCVMSYFEGEHRAGHEACFEWMEAAP